MADPRGDAAGTAPHRPPAPRRRPAPWPAPVRALVATAVVVALVAADVRLLTSRAYLSVAYGALRPDDATFPGPAAWTAASAMATADYVALRRPRPAVAGLAAPEAAADPSVADLGRSADDDAAPARTAAGGARAPAAPSPPALYGAAELDHLADVRRVIGALFALGLAGAAVVAAALAADAAAGGRRAAAAIAAGGRLGLGLMAAAGALIALAWDRLFTAFHAVLFAPGTWRFPVDSGLIRLFPDWFWQRSAIVLAGLLLAQCALVAVVAGRRGGAA